MSKIICDICGTAYPETAKQCPICGSVRPGDVQRVTNEVKSDGKVSTGYTYVKGGRFSKSNVKKRSNADNSSKRTSPKKESGEDVKSNRGLVATAIVLLLAIIGVVIYIALRFFGPISDPSANTNNTENNDSVACVDIVLDESEILFDEVGVAKLLNVTVSPENSTDKVTYRSEDESIATVSDKGKVTAITEGSTKIIITCGDVVKECVVTIQLPEETTLPTIEDTTAGTEDTTVPDETIPAEEELRLNRKDSFTLQYKGETWDLYSGSIPRNQITWSIGDQTVATVDNGKVVAVGEGYTYVYAEYEGQKVSCQVICNFKESSGIQGNGGVSEDGGSSGNGGVSADGGNTGSVTPAPGAYKIYSPYGKVEDITLKVGESLKLSLKDSSGNVVEAKWQSTSSAVSVSGSTIKGVAKIGYAKVIATYNGNGYECIIRVN